MTGAVLHMCQIIMEGNLSSDELVFVINTKIMAIIIQIILFI